ncbi:MAG TPA: DnaA/Hda family protein, partial [Pirellulales bacterium]
MIDASAPRLPELMQALTEQLGSERMATWFDQVALQIADKTVRVLCPNSFLHKWLRDSFGAELRLVVKRTLGTDVRVEFVVEAAPPAPAAPPKPTASVGPNATTATATEHQLAVLGDDAPAIAGKIEPVADRRPGAKARQTRLALDPEDVAPIGGAAASRGRRFSNFDTFVVGPSNKLAYTAATMAAEQPGQVNPIVFHGPAGVGKTHLLEAVWTAVKKRDPRRQIVYLSAEQFTTHYVEALSGGLPSFRRKYRGVDVLMLDDVQFFRGKKATLIELLHTIDALASSGRQVVMAADRPPHELTDLGPEIVGRLGGGLVVRIDAPDEQVRRGVIRGISERLNLNLSSDVQEYVAGRLTGCCRELTGALNR